MVHYIPETEFNAITYRRDEINHREFEGCTFNGCNFSHCVFVAVSFIDCTFNDCTFTDAKINYVAFRTVYFNRCEIKDVNFSMCDKLLFEIHFKGCLLDFSKFYTLKIKGTTFTDCSIIAADFMNTDLTGVLFDNCDLYRSEFAKAIAHKCDFLSSYNYIIDPRKTKISKAIFSLAGVKGLLATHDITVV